MVDVNGKFVNSAGVAVKSSDFETTSDVGASIDIYYYNLQTVWVYIKNKSASPEATFARLAFGFSYCFEPANSADCTIGTLANSDVTVSISSATELIFASRPSAAGKGGCKFSITPSSVLKITLTTSGTAPAHLVAAYQTSTSTYVPSLINSNTDTVFPAPISVTFAFVATSNVQNSGTMIVVTIEATTKSGLTLPTSSTSTLNKKSLMQSALAFWTAFMLYL